MVRLEHCKTLTSWQSWILPSVPLQVTSKGCEDDTAMLRGTPKAASSEKLSGIPAVRAGTKPNITSFISQHAVIGLGYTIVDKKNNYSYLRAFISCLGPQSVSLPLE